MKTLYAILALGATVPVAAYFWSQRSEYYKRACSSYWSNVNIHFGPQDEESDDEEAVELSDETPARGKEPETVVLVRVRRGHARKFIQKWVAWAKAEFPQAYMMTGMANRTVLGQRISKEMRKQSVRDVDIVRYLPRVVVGALMPNVHEREAELFLNSITAYQERESLVPKRSFMSWLLGADKRIQWSA